MHYRVVYYREMAYHIIFQFDLKHYYKYSLTVPRDFKPLTTVSVANKLFPDMLFTFAVSQLP